MTKKNLEYWIIRLYRKLFVKPILFNRTYAVFLIDEENNLRWQAGNFWFLKEARNFKRNLDFTGNTFGIRKYESVIMKIYND